MKLRAQLFLGFFLLTGAGFYFLTVWILKDLRPRYLETSEEALVDTANLLASILETEMVNDSIPVYKMRETFKRIPGRKISALIYDLKKNQMDLRIYITNSEGMVLFDSDQGRDEGKNYSSWRDVYLTLRGQYGARATRINPHKAATSVLYVAAPIRFENKIVGVLSVSKPSNSINVFINAARPKIILAGVIAALAVAALGIILTTLVTSPINALTNYARSIRDGRPFKRPTFGRSEVGELGQAFEEMREALEGKKYVEEYIQTLTHELKSPLSSVRGASELLQEEMPIEKRNLFLKNILSEVNRMQALVDRMLDLSGLESRRSLQEAQKVDISILVKEILLQFIPKFSLKKIVLINELAENCLVIGEKFLLQQAINNLIENAFAFSPFGGKITVKVNSEEVKTNELEKEIRIIIEVLDSGPGIPEFALGRVFEKFFSLQRPDTGKKSSGLGLTIVQVISQLHGGHIELKNQNNSGLHVKWALPSALS